MLKIILSLLVILFINCSASATNYYVKNGGNDAANGLSNANAWATIAKVNTSTFSPGDTIFFNKGDVWREMLSVSSSGTSENYIVFTSYGTGANPRILGSEKTVTWTNTAGNIWQSATSMANPKPDADDGDLYFINTNLSARFGVYQTYTIDFSNLTSEFDWTWNDNTVYVYSPEDPDTRYNSIEASQRTASIYLNGQQYIEINGIDLFYGQNAGVQESLPTGNLSGFILSNGEIAWIGYPNGNGCGLQVCYNESLVEFNTIHDCGRAGIAIRNNGNSDITNWIVQNNILYNGNHITGVEVTSGLTGTSGSLNNILIRNNLIYDNADREMNEFGSNLIDLINDPANASSINGILIYNNVIKNPAGTGILLQNIAQSALYNNTFYCMNQSYTLNGIYQIMYDNDCGPSILKNNIFYSNGNYDINQNISSIYISSTSDWTKIDADCNLYYSEDPRQYIVSLEGAGSYKMENWSVLKSDLAWETHSPIPSDPLFFSSDDYHLQQNSPAIAAGLDIPGYTTDFEDKPVSTPPNIGAYQGGGLFPGKIGSAQSICYNTVPAPLTQITAPSEGTGIYSYQWQRYNGSNWQNISGATLPEYSPPALIESTYFRRTVTSGIDFASSTPVLITVSSQITYVQLYCDTIIPSNTITNFYITIIGGTPPFTVNYTRNGVTQPTIHNYLSSQNISTGILTTGVYTYALTSVVDAIGCMAQSLGNNSTITVNGNGNLYPGSIGSAQTICYNTVPAPLQFITLPTGGTGEYNFQWQSSPDGASWTNIPGATNVSYQPPALTTSTYFRFTITSGSFIPVNTNSILITVLLPITDAQLHDDISIPENTSVNFSIEISGGNPPFSIDYSRNGIAQSHIYNYSSGTDITTGILTTGVYIYTLKSVTDANGCEAQSLGTDIIVTITGEISDIPNVFTPNGDGINETWHIRSFINSPDAVIRIYDRRLKLIIQYSGSDPDWDGRDSNGNPLPEGAYLYGIDLKNGKKPIKGYISIIK